MSAPGIVFGDPRGILQLPPTAMKNPSAWKITDSELIAHFIQVHSQIRSSRWYAADVKFTTQGGQLLESEYPDLEAFVFAAVYFRQLFAKGDQLLNGAVDRYREFVDCRIRDVWVKREQESFAAALDGPAWPLTAYTVRDLFEAYLYGAGLFHKFPEPADPKRSTFLAVYDKEKPYTVLYALNGSLRRILNHVSAIVVVIYRDFGHWQKTYSLQLPDVRWHEGLFNVWRPAPFGPPSG
jgi:hypothetical protein